MKGLVIDHQCGKSICYSDSQVYYANAAKYIIVVVSDGFAGCKAERCG